MTDIRFVNDEEIVARQSKMTAINSCVEVIFRPIVLYRERNIKGNQLIH